MDDYPAPYLTAAVALGMTQVRSFSAARCFINPRLQTEIDTFVERLDKVLVEFKTKVERGEPVQALGPPAEAGDSDSEEAEAEPGAGTDVV